MGKSDLSVVGKKTQPRLVVVSNRVGPVIETARAGGLAVALVDAMREQGGLWFGWSGDISGSSLSRATVKHHGKVSLATVPLSQEDYDEQGVADALQTAIDMPLEERRNRWRALMAGLRKDDVGAWAEAFLDQLRSPAAGRSGRRA